jgi:hypothetical protein
VSIEEPVIQSKNQGDNRPLGCVGLRPRLDFGDLEGFYVAIIPDEPCDKAVGMELSDMAVIGAALRSPRLAQLRIQAFLRVVSGLPDVAALCVAAQAEAINVEAHAAFTRSVGAGKSAVERRRLRAAAISRIFGCPFHGPDRCRRRTMR